MNSQTARPYLILRPWIATIALMTLFWVLRERHYGETPAALMVEGPLILFAILFWWRSVFKIQAAWSSGVLGLVLVVSYIYEFSKHSLAGRPPLNTLILAAALFAICIYESGDRKQSLWALAIFRLIVIQVYFFAAFSKFTSPFLSGFVLEQAYFGGFAGAAAAFTPSPQFFKWLSWLAIITELTIPTGLFFRPTRKWSIGLGVLFHIAAAFFMPVTLFSASMVLCLLFFVDQADLTHRFNSRGH